MQDHHMASHHHYLVIIYLKGVIPLDHVAHIGSSIFIIWVTLLVILCLFPKGGESVPNYRSESKLETLDKYSSFRVDFKVWMAFVVWNTLVSLGEQKQYYMGSDSYEGSGTSNTCYMAQKDNPFEVNFKSEVDENIDMPYDELACFVNNFLKNMKCWKWKINV